MGHRACQGSGITRRNEQAAAALPYEIGLTREIAGHHGDTACQGLEELQRKQPGLGMAAHICLGGHPGQGARDDTRDLPVGQTPQVYDLAVSGRSLLDARPLDAVTGYAARVAEAGGVGTGAAERYWSVVRS